MFEALTEAPYRFPYYMLAWSLTVALMSAVLFPWSIVAYKIARGGVAIDEDYRDELLQRSFYLGIAQGLAAVLVVLLDYVAIDDGWLGLPAGPFHVVFLVVFVALTAWLMYYFFSLEDFFQGLMIAVIYLYVPTVLFVITFGHKWNLLFTYLLTWMKDPKPT